MILFWCEDRAREEWSGQQLLSGHGGWNRWSWKGPSRPQQFWGLCRGVCRQVWVWMYKLLPDLLFSWSCLPKTVLPATRICFPGFAEFFSPASKLSPVEMMLLEGVARRKPLAVGISSVALIYHSTSFKCFPSFFVLEVWICRQEGALWHLMLRNLLVLFLLSATLM